MVGSMRRLLLLTAALAATSAAAQNSVAGLTWTPASGWKTDAPKPMRVVTYQVPAAKGDTEGGELAVFYFGAGQGGATEANIQRWIGQLSQPDGSPSAKAAKRSTRKVNGMPVALVDVTGTYTASMGPMGPKTAKPGFRLLGAVVEGPQGSVFFKLTGPAKTVAATEKDFQKLVDSVKAG